ncbi:hypothetical protein D3C72_1981000 [compost metagenome]
MRTKAEAKRRFWLAVDVEFVGVFERLFIAVGGRHDALHHRPFRNRYTTNLQVFGRLAHLEGRHRLKAHRLINRLVHQAAIVAHPLQHIGVLQQ